VPMAAEAACEKTIIKARQYKKNVTVFAPT
jgi:hypothetical protein